MGGWLAGLLHRRQMLRWMDGWLVESEWRNERKEGELSERRNGKFIGFSSVAVVRRSSARFVIPKDGVRLDQKTDKQPKVINYSCEGCRQWHKSFTKKQK